MDRKEFLKKGACLCSALFLCGAARADDSANGTAKEEEAAKKEEEQRKKFISDWTEHLMHVLDTNLPLKTRTAIMEACGRGCSERGYGQVVKMCKGNLDTLNRTIKSQWADDVQHDREKNVVRIIGKKMKSCYCPMVQGKTTFSSRTYCLCSKGWMKETFEKVTGKKVEVELEQTILRGGERCIFKMTIV